MNWGTEVQISPAYHCHLLTEASASCRVPIKYFWRPLRVSHICLCRLPLNMPGIHGGPWFPPGYCQPCCCPSRHTHETLGGLHGVLHCFRFGQSCTFLCWCGTCHTALLWAPCPFLLCRDLPSRLSPPSKPLPKKSPGFQCRPDSRWVQTRISSSEAKFRNEDKINKMPVTFSSFVNRTIFARCLNISQRRKNTPWKFLDYIFDRSGHFSYYPLPPDRKWR